MEQLKYLWILIVGMVMAVLAAVLGKQTTSTAEAQIRLVEAKKRKNVEALDRIEADKAKARSDKRRAQLARRSRALSEQTDTLTDTSVSLRAIVRGAPVDDATLAREVNRRRRADKEPNGTAA